MPLTHVIFDGDVLTLDEARERAASRDPQVRWTPELLDAILATRQERDYVSTTSLTAKCLRQNAIQRQYDYAEDIDKMWAAFRGTMFHGQLEKHVGEGAIEEARFFVTIDGVQFSGSPDLVDPRSGVLYDYKFCKEVPRWNKPWADHVEQLNINRWLVDHAEKVEWRGKEYKGKALAQFRPVDWQDLVVVYMDDKGVKPLRCTKSIQVPKVSGDGTKPALVSDVWSDEQCEDLIYERFPLAVSALLEGEIPPPPEGWEHQSHILCTYCPVFGECSQLEAKGK